MLRFSELSEQFATNRCHHGADYKQLLNNSSSAVNVFALIAIFKIIKLTKQAVLILVPLLIIRFSSATLKEVV